MGSEPQEREQGVAVDAQGGPVVDPTKNVQDLSIASNRRQDDLREAQNKYMELGISNMKELFLAKSEQLDKLIILRNEQITEIVAVRAEHAKELSAKETQRLDSIRQVDQLAVTTAANRALDAIQALAATTTANADNLRTSQSNMAATIAAQTATQLSAITERIAALEKSSYEGAGKQAYSDPMMSQMVLEMKALKESTSRNRGEKAGIGQSWGVMVAVAGLLLAFMLFYVTNKSSAPATTAAPQIIYVPAPQGTMVPSSPSVNVPSK